MAFIGIITIFIGGILLILLVRLIGRGGDNKEKTEKGAKAYSSFYVEEDGTIIRGGNKESTEPLPSVIIHDTNEQKEALSLIQESADAGIAEAQYYLGLCYEQGSVVKKDIEKAKKWYRLAASQSYPLAKFRLGKLLMENKQ